MKTFSYTITDEVGIHARPAGLLAKKAKEFESVCTIEKGGKSVNITKLMALMGLGVKQGDTVTVTCEGADEDKASEALKAIIICQLGGKSRPADGTFLRSVCRSVPSAGNSVKNNKIYEKRGGYL